MQFEWTLNIGHVLTAGGIIITLITMWTLFGERLSNMTLRIASMEHQLDQLTKVAIVLAETDQRLKNIDTSLLEQSRRLNNLDEHGSRGIGAVQARLEHLEERVKSNYEECVQWARACRANHRPARK